MHCCQDEGRKVAFKRREGGKCSPDWEKERKLSTDLLAAEVGPPGLKEMLQ